MKTGVITGMLAFLLPLILSIIFKRINYGKIVKVADDVLDKSLGDKASQQIQSEIANILEGFANALRGDLVDNSTIEYEAEKHLNLLENNDKKKQILAEFADELLKTEYYGDKNFVSQETIGELLKKYIDKYREA